MNTPSVTPPPFAGVGIPPLIPVNPFNVLSIYRQIYIIIGRIFTYGGGRGILKNPYL